MIIKPSNHKERTVIKPTRKRIMSERIAYSKNHERKDSLISAGCTAQISHHNLLLCTYQQRIFKILLVKNLKEFQELGSYKSKYRTRSYSVLKSWWRNVRN